MKTLFLTFAIAVAAANSVLASIATSHDYQSDACGKLASCSSCLSKSYCTWCINQSKCTKQSCGNDNIIYPRRVKAFLSGPEFCPRVIRDVKEDTFPNGKKHLFVIKLTQIHLYMAFTPWKCKINLNGEETVVDAVLRADEVYCEAVLLSNKSDKPLEGSATVLWDNRKSFDGSLLFKVSV